MVSQTETGSKDGDNTPSLNRRRLTRKGVDRLRGRNLVKGDANKSKRLSKRRKAALVVSAGAMGLSTAAEYAKPFANTTIERQVSYNQKVDGQRAHASTMTASGSFKAALIEEEGVREVVYRDVAGYPTVGVGHLVTASDNLSVGDRVSYDQILQFLADDLAIAEAAVVRLAGDLPLHQHEFDALLDLVYNVGEGNVSERKSPKLNAAIQAGDYYGIASELAYHHAAGAKANGLINRSERRTAIFLDANYEDPRDLA